MCTARDRCDKSPARGCATDWRSRREISVRRNAGVARGFCDFPVDNSAFELDWQRAAIHELGAVRPRSPPGARCGRCVRELTMSVARKGVGAQARAHARGAAARARASGARQPCRRRAGDAHAALDLLRHAGLSPAGAGHLLPAAIGGRQLAADGQDRNGGRERSVEAERGGGRRRAAGAGPAGASPIAASAARIEKAVSRSILEPVFETVVQRTTRHLHCGRGRARAGARRRRRARRRQPRTACARPSWS